MEKILALTNILHLVEYDLRENIGMNFINAVGPLKQSLPISLLRAREALMVHYRTMLARFDMTEQQWRVLGILKEKSPLEAAELAVEAYILAPSLTRILRSLEGRQLIIRSKNAADGRRSILKISPLGTDFLNKVGPQSQAIQNAFLAQFGQENLAQLFTLLHEIEGFRYENSEP